MRLLNFKEFQEFKHVGDDSPTISPSYHCCKNSMNIYLTCMFPSQRLILRKTDQEIIWFCGSDGQRSGWSQVPGDDPEVQHVC